jgi:hypothetical protein
MHLPAPRTQYASEFGHLLRIASVHSRLEAALNAADGNFILILYARAKLLTLFRCIARVPAHDAKSALEETEKDISVRIPFLKGK